MPRNGVGRSVFRETFERENTKFQVPIFKKPYGPPLGIDDWRSELLFTRGARAERSLPSAGAPRGAPAAPAGRADGTAMPFSASARDGRLLRTSSDIRALSTRAAGRRRCPRRERNETAPAPR